MPEYRLDVVTDPDPDSPVAVFYFEAADHDGAAEQAQRLLAALDGPEDRYGDLLVRDGENTGSYVETIHLDLAGAAS